MLVARLQTMMTRNYRFPEGSWFVPTLLMFFPVVLHAGDDVQEITIIRSDSRSLTIEYRPQHDRPTVVAKGLQQYQQFDFAGSVAPDPETTEGSPDLRFRYLPLCIPSAVGNAVTVIAADYEDIPGVFLSPVPSLYRRDGSIEVREYAHSPSAYNSNSFRPAQLVELAPPRNVAGLLVSGVSIFPIQYNPVSRILRKYTRLVVQVTYGAPGSGREQPPDGPPFIHALLNAEFAAGWTRSSAADLRKSAGFASVLATGVWYRLSVNEEGIYALNAQVLRAAGINLTGIDPRTIKIYGNGGTEVPEDLASPRPNDLVENAIVVEGEEDGQFDATDVVLFYGQGVKGWTYDPNRKSFSHYINHYTETNYYWLTYGGAPGRRMGLQQSSTESPAVFPSSFQAASFVEEEKINLLRSGKEWYGNPINSGASVTYTTPLPGLDPNSTITYRFKVIARAAVAPSFVVRQQDAIVGSFSLGVVDYESPFLYATSASAEAAGTSSLSANTSQLSFAFTAGDVSASGFVDWVEIFYPRRFEAANNLLAFRSPDTTGVVEYRLSGFNSIPLIFNISRFDDVRRVAGGSTSGFRFREDRESPTRYIAASRDAFKSPLAIEWIANQNLHADPSGAEFVIVTSQEFRDAADRLAQYRQQPGYGGLKTVVVNVDKIYNEFSGGLPDVSAIRDFLKYAYDTWTPRPRYVLMFGQASYDYKGILGGKSSYVPTWQSAESRDDIGSWATDDFFVKFGSTDVPYIVTGRLSPRRAAEATGAVEKIIRYEENSVRDAWKMRMLFIGDDSWTPSAEDGTLHSQAAEELAVRHTPDEFEKKKIYLAEYPTVFGADGRRKPGAYQAIIDQINQGVLAVNFTGHGNPSVWTHERVFSVDTSIPQLVNNNRFPVFFAATCNFSEFDDPKTYTGSELLINKSDGGAIAVLSATRKVFAGGNNYLHQSIFDMMFGRDRFGRLTERTVAEALFAFKAVGPYGNNINDQKFFLMGDPTMRLQYPTGNVSIDSINHEPVDSLDGRARMSPIQLKALTIVSIKGTIRDSENRPDQGFAGKVTLQANDASRTVKIVNFAPGIDWEYTASGSTIYRGEASVTRGNFEATFVVPKDIAYVDSTDRARLVVYANGGGVDGAGYTSGIWVGGTDTAAGKDASGPGMRIYIGSRAFRQGDIVGDSPLLLVDLDDSSGINTSISGIGHRIELWMNNSSQSRDVSEYYTSKLDDFRQGTVQVGLGGLMHGRNTIRIRAWDSYNNPSSEETYFEVSSSDRLTLADIFNYPNPFATETQFTFRQNLQEILFVKIKIYTIAGRLIQTLETTTSGEPFVQIPWDGRDRDGDSVANGVYLYKIIAATFDGRLGSESLGKLSVIK
jgi:hypothetical protein